MLFNDTILQNVLNGLHGGQVDHLGEEQKRKLVVDACIQANAHDFIMSLPQGYDTNVGERANLLSGGQRQRIAIARSVISNPKILLLDEATSALDSESENAVQAALEKSSRGRTVLMISHKLSAVEKANKIIVIDKGRIVEQGTHATLLAADGVYCRLLHAQTLGTPAETDTTPTSNKKAKQELVEKLPLQEKDSHTDGSVKTAQVPESKSISRRFSLLRCVLIILSETRNVLLPFTGGTIGTLVAGACIPMQAFLFSKLVTVFQLQGAERINRGNFWALMFFALALANLTSYAVLWFLFALVGATISQKYRAEYLRSMLSQDIPFFELKGNESGALAALLSTDGGDLEALFALSLALILVFFIDIFACGIIAIVMGWKLGLVGVFGCYPVLFLAGYFRMRMDSAAQDRCALNFLESARFALEAIEAVRTVSSLTMEPKVIERYGVRIRNAVITSSKRMMVSTIFFSLSDCIDFLGKSSNHLASR
jgi:ATP-binding cassette, subfamily B (MDR/TAP), member 1